jgi:hypothetical protein
MVLRSANRRALEMTVAERMKTENTSKNGIAPLRPLDMKPKEKDATTE